jgi:hypothetical protein
MIRKIAGTLCCLFLFTASLCDNEPIDQSVIDSNLESICQEAIMIALEAETEFINHTDSNYNQLCINYKEALIAQINICGDTDGSLQNTVDNLGDCFNNTNNACELAILATQQAQEEFLNANASNYSALCTNYKLQLEHQIIVCGESAELLNIIGELGNCNTNDQSVLCNGNGSTSLFPLVIGNQWEYTESINGANTSLQLVVISIENINGIDYFKIEVSSNIEPSYLYLRLASNGDIYQLFQENSGNFEKMYLPANPTLNQQWDYHGVCLNGNCQHFRKVDSINFFLETDNCVYENCILVKNYTILDGGEITQQGTRIYKQGIGIVGGFNATTFTSVILN